MSRPVKQLLADMGRAALAAAEPHIQQRVDDAARKAALEASRIEREAVRFSLPVTIATRERSACVACLGRAVAACQRVARSKRGAKQVAASHAALECVEAVRALMTEVAP